MKKYGQKWKSTNCARNVNIMNSTVNYLEMGKTRILEKFRRIKYKIATVKEREGKIIFMEKRGN